MNKNINWNSIAAPLDIRKVYSHRHFIWSWKIFEWTENGVCFSCELAIGDPNEYFVDKIQDDIIRFRMNPLGLRTEPSDMLVEITSPPCKFNLLESEGLITLITTRIRVEYPGIWQISAYDDSRPTFGQVFSSERTDDRVYGPGYEVAPSGYDIGDDGEISIRESVSVKPGESFYGLGEKFTSLDRWNQEIPLWAVDFTNPDACLWWQSKLDPLLDIGVAVFKTDFGEQAPNDAIYADGHSGLEIDNICPLLENRTAFELTRKEFRWELFWGWSAYTGLQKYSVQWGGAILPFEPEMEILNHKALDPLTIEIYDPKGIGKFDNLDEEFPIIPVKYKRENNLLETAIGNSMGLLEIILYGVVSRKARFGDKIFNVSSYNGG